jgi:hypothetical protein
VGNKRKRTSTGDSLAIRRSQRTKLAPGAQQIVQQDTHSASARLFRRSYMIEVQPLYVFFLFLVNALLILAF